VKYPELTQETAELKKLIDRLKDVLCNFTASDPYFEIETAIDQLEDLYYYLNEDAHNG
jgi:hypothetical protein